MRHKVEIFDCVQYLFDKTGFNDHQLHCVVHFENKLKEEILERAVRLLVKVVPALSRSYRNFGGKSYWEDVDPHQWTDLFTVVDSKEDFDRFTFSKTNEDKGPQIKVCLLRSSGDSLSIILNHMVTDGAGMKQCAYLLSDLYTNLLKNPQYSPEFVIDGDRSMKQVLQGIRTRDKIKSLLFHRKDNNQNSDVQFPLSSGGETFPFILTQEVKPETFDRIRTICKENKATVNDVILTSYYRVLSKLLHLDGKPFGIPIMIDMRRYLDDKGFHALTNLSSTEILKIIVEPGEDFSQTLASVVSEMNAKKGNFLGLNTFVKLETLFRICRRNSGFRLLERSLKNPSICMTNIGILDSGKLVFQGSPIRNAFICGSIKHRPHFQMSVSSFQDKMTFCVNLYGNSQDQEAIMEFFALMDKELEQEIHR